MAEKHAPPLEIERKFLIHMPRTEDLIAAGAHVFHIEQTYLVAPRGLSRRVRRLREGNDLRYFYTEKVRISPATAEEREREIDLLEYASLLGERDTARMTIEKTRYAIPCEDGHTAEVDVYEFWHDRATVEVELASEDEAFSLPPCLSVVREITADKRYKNAALAKELPCDPL
ncbi:MAG: hypothetical protein IJ009_01145 [Clostridia bacterium]|nr:hypothetical protein [Clostridia bacterium]